MAFRIGLLFLISVTHCLASDTALPENLYFDFTNEQRIIFDQTYEKRKKGFLPTNFRTSKEGTSYKAKIHLRGLGTLKYCNRKSFTLELPRDFNLRLLENSDLKDYVLISMCQDRNFLRSHTLYSLWQDIGLFPLKFRMVELQIDEQSFGLYILIEKPAAGLPNIYNNVTSVLRRSITRPLETYTVKYSSTTKTIAAGDYVNTFLDIDHLHGDALIVALENKIDLQQFITHLASASILVNGDYIDELWLIGQQIKTQHSVLTKYNYMKWDPDSVFTICHHDSKYAYNDPWGIAFCAESDLAKQILKEPKLYNTLINRIEELLNNQLSPQRFQIELNKTFKLLKIKLKNKNALVAMANEFYPGLETTTAKEAIIRIKNEQEKLLAKYNARRALLLEKISIYRKANNN